jgi:hypothetical protein
VHDPVVQSGVCPQLQVTEHERDTETPRIDTVQEAEQEGGVLQLLSCANASTFASESADKSLLCKAMFTFTAAIATTATAAIPSKIFFFIILKD